MSIKHRLHASLLAGLGALLLAGAAQADQVPPRCVILLIGDGMGIEHVKAASLAAHGTSGGLWLEQLPQRAIVSTLSLDGTWAATDSAAAATALATGRKAMNGTLSVKMSYPQTQPFDANGDQIKPLDAPGDIMPTVLELAQAAGKRTGLVTTTDITDATPAAFAAHVPSRLSDRDIVSWYVKTRPNVLMGGGLSPPAMGGYELLEEDAEEVVDLPAVAKEAGYTVAHDRSELLAINTTATERMWGIFGTSHMRPCFDAELNISPSNTMPRLFEMTRTALAVLDREPKGFFLMVEGGNIDKYAHKGNTPYVVGETLEFDRAVAEVMAWAKGRDDTLVIVLADHETGGLVVTESKGKGNLPEVRWDAPNKLIVRMNGTWVDLSYIPELLRVYGSRDHTQIPVGAWAWGKGAQAVAGEMDNTDFFKIITGRPPPEPIKNAPRPTSVPTTRPATMPAELLPF
jgi:alkaline phosphatase